MELPVARWEDYHQPGRIYNLAWLRCDAHYAYHRHGHAGQWELVYVDSGQFRHAIGSASLDQRRGTLLLIRPGDVHSLRGSGFSYFNLAFPLSCVERLEAGLRPPDEAIEPPSFIGRLGEEPTPPRLDLGPGRQAELENRLHALMTRYDPLGFMALLTGLLVDFMESYPTPDGSGQGETDTSAALPAPPDWLELAIRQARLARKIPDLDQVLAWCGRSPEHVARSFRRSLGCTPTQFLVDLRLQKACQLLERTNWKIRAIATETGFDSPNYFHKLFRRRFGASPADWRRERSSLPHH